MAQEYFAIVSFPKRKVDDMKISLFRTEREAEHYAEVIEQHNPNFACYIISAIVAPRIKGRRYGTKVNKEDNQ